MISKDYDEVGEDTMITAFALYNDDDNADNGSVLSEMRFKFNSIKAKELFMSLIIDEYRSYFELPKRPLCKSCKSLTEPKIA